MSIKRKMFFIMIIIMVIVMADGQLSGEVKISGKLSILTAKGAVLYDAVITITPAEITIKCAKKIFQPFNRFDVPKRSILKINTGEICKIQIKIKNNEVLIIANDYHHHCYRHLFQPVWRLIQWLPLEKEKKGAIIFFMDNPADIVTGEELIKIIGKRCHVIKANNQNG